VAAAFAKCLPSFGQGRGAGPQSAPTP
jgi:hypothetical protein